MRRHHRKVKFYIHFGNFYSTCNYSYSVTVKQNEQTHAKLAKNKSKKEPSTSPFAPSTPAPDTVKYIEQQTAPADLPVLTNNQPTAPAVAEGLDNANLKPAGAASAPANEHTSSADVAVPVPSQKNMLTKSTMTMAPTQHFRIRLMTNEEVSATTTLPVHAQMFMGDVLELVCRKRKLDTNEYILTFADYNMIVPNDTTVESLSGIIDLCLVKKSAATGLHVASCKYFKPLTKHTDVDSNGFLR